MSNLNTTQGGAVASNANQKMRVKSQSNVDSQEMRRRREEEGVQIRKSKREQQLTKKRNVTGSSDAAIALDSINDPLLDDSALFGANVSMGVGSLGGAGQPSNRFEISEKLVEMLYSDTEDDQLLALRRFRKMLSIEPNPPIDQVIKTGILPRFVQLLQNSNNSLMQFEAAWTLTNIASGNSAQTRMVIQAGAVPIFINLMTSQYYDVREQAVWALGNITGDSPEFRDYVINCNFIKPLIEILNSKPSIAMKRNAVWAISNCCRGKNPSPDFVQLLPVVPNLVALIHENDLEVIADACWAISYLCDGPNEKIQSIIDAGACPRLVELLMHNDAQITQAALRAVGNIVTGDDLQTQVMINCSVLTCLHNLLVHGKEVFRKEACWSLSNITAGTKEQIDAVIDEGIVPSLIITLQCGEFRTRKEAAWALTNITSGGNSTHVRFLVENGCIPPFCDLLTVMDTKIILVALTGLQNILRFGESEVNSFTKVNPYATLIEECYGLDKIEFLQTHENNEIYQKAYEIVCTYFSNEVEDGCDLAPATDSTNKYQFEADQAVPEGGFNF